MHFWVSCLEGGGVEVSKNRISEVSKMQCWKDGVKFFFYFGTRDFMDLLGMEECLKCLCPPIPDAMSLTLKS